jgi:hypothetical protein
MIWVLTFIFSLSSFSTSALACSSSAVDPYDHNAHTSYDYSNTYGEKSTNPKSLMGFELQTKTKPFARILESKEHPRGLPMVYEGKDNFTHDGTFDTSVIGIDGKPNRKKTTLKIKNGTFRCGLPRKIIHLGPDGSCLEFDSLVQITGTDKKGHIEQIFSNGVVLIKFENDAGVTYEPHFVFEVTLLPPQEPKHDPKKKHVRFSVYQVSAAQTSPVPRVAWEAAGPSSGTSSSLSLVAED